MPAPLARSFRTGLTVADPTARYRQTGPPRFRPPSPARRVRPALLLARLLLALRSRPGQLTGEPGQRGWIHKAGNDGFIKLIEDAPRGVLAGASSAGPAGGEVLGALTVAVHAQVPVADLQAMIYAYPTFHRAIEDALRNLATADQQA